MSQIKMSYIQMYNMITFILFNYVITEACQKSVRKNTNFTKMQIQIKKNTNIKNINFIKLKIWP